MPDPVNGLDLSSIITDGTTPANRATMEAVGEAIIDETLSRVPPPTSNATENVIHLTHAALTTKINSNTLVQGQKYLITDFMTIYTQPVTNNVIYGVATNGTMGTFTNTNYEPLLVTALSSNALEPIAFSPSNPYDVIYYDPTKNNTNRYAWATYTDKGQIYRRVTKNNNDIPYDVRAIRFRRYQVDASAINAWSSATINKGDIVQYSNKVYIALRSGSSSSFPGSSFSTDIWKLMCPTTGSSSYISFDDYDGLSVCIGSIVTSYTVPVSPSSYKDFYTFDDGNEENQVDASTVYNNIIAPYIYTSSSIVRILNNSVFIGTNFYNNTIGTNFNKNTIGNDFYDNTIGNDSHDNTIDSGFRSNTIDSSFYSNTISTNFQYNTIGSGFRSNTIGDGIITTNLITPNFQNNTIGNDFNVNVISGVFSSNNIGNSFSQNTISTSFTSNTIGNGFRNNTIGNNFSQNTIGSNFHTNTFGDNSHDNNIGSSFFGNIVGTFHNNTIGNYFQYNTTGNFLYNNIGSSFQSNTIGNYFQSNTIGNNSHDNNIGSNFQYNTIGNDSHDNTIGSNFRNNTIGNSFSQNTIGNNWYYNCFGERFQNQNMSALNAAASEYSAYRYNEFAAGCFRAKTWTTGGNVANKMQNDMPVKIVMGNGSNSTMMAITYDNSGNQDIQAIGA